MNFSEKLSKLRKANNLSQEQLAEKLGVSRQAVSRWELGETTPDMLNLVGLCDIFGVSADYLIRDLDSNTSATPPVSAHAAAFKPSHNPLLTFVSALGFQIASVGSIISVCYSTSALQQLISGLAVALFSAATFCQLIRYGRSL